MNSSWQLKKFGECAELIRNTCRPDEIDEVPYIGLEHIEEGTLRLLEVGKSKDVISVKSQFQSGDILFGKLRPYFRKVVRPSFSGVCSTDIWVVRSKDGVNQDFLFYWMASQEFVDSATQASEGTKMPRAKWDFLERIEKPVPPLPEQSAIAHILGVLDDKIELNREMNKTLEFIAQALFKSWFVDFEPFLDKGMQDSQLGEIPVEWGIGTLSQICEVKMGQSPPGDTYNETGEGISFYQGIRDFGHRFPHPRVYCTMPTRFAEPNDVLLSVRAPVGSLNVANERCAIGRGLSALCSKERNYSYLYYLLCNIKILWDTFNSEGTVFGCITKKDIADIKIILPPAIVVERFESLVSTMDRLIANNEQEIRTLSETRDSLLPKFMSGEIRVKDAEKFMEKAA